MASQKIKKQKKSQKYILWFKDISYKDVPLVGGKNASLGEMFNAITKKGINVPNGFAFTTKAYWSVVKENRIDEKLKKIFGKTDTKNIKSLQRTGKLARKLFLNARFPDDIKQDIFKAYYFLSKKYGRNYSVAIRSSGVCEDMPDASFAGQFETFLNVRGKENLLRAIKKCLASAFNDRAIAYRDEKKISQLEFALSIGILKMIRSDLSSSGVIFTLDTETGFRNVILINSIWGIGEMIVKGRITPDEFYVFKPTLDKAFKPIILKNLGRKNEKLIYGSEGGLKQVAVPLRDRTRFSISDSDILILAKWAQIIEKHYGVPQDLEWAKDGKSGKLFIVQSRPETIHSAQKISSYKEYKIQTRKMPILKGIAIGSKIVQGKARVISDISKISRFKEGEILVSKMTDPDWVPIMRIAKAIITNEGSKVCHAAIVSRELGVPCVVGTMNATKILKTGQTVTVDCTRGLDGRVFAGSVPFKVKQYNLEEIPKMRANLKTKIMLNIGAPDIAFKASFLPNDGVGLAREEFIIAEKIKIHPLALYHYSQLKSQLYSAGRRKKRYYGVPKSELKKIIKKIETLTIEHQDKKEYFIKELAEGIAQIAAAFYPKEVIVRFSDFKTNEYRNLLGGILFEGEETNPMLGFRGACRYLDKAFQPAFKMECEAIKRVRNIFGLKNVSVMVPFCRTVEEGKKVVQLIKRFGLVHSPKSKRGLKIYVMCEIPSNVILADEFLKVFDGMSIGSNDLTQLALGLDRDNAKIAKSFDERDETIKKMVKSVIDICNKKKRYCGICGQAPSDFPEFAQFLIECGIPSISLSPDVVVKTIFELSKKR